MKTRVGAEASVRSSANSFAASVSGRPRTVAHARHRVDLQRADAQHPALQPRARAAQHRVDPVAQLDVHERLDHVVVDAALEPAHAIELAAAAGEHDQRQRRIEPGADAVGGPDAPDQVQPGAVREPEVDDREVRAPRLELAQRLLDRARDEQVVAVGGEVVGQERPDHRVVLDDQDAIGHGKRRRGAAEKLRPPAGRG